MKNRDFIENDEFWGSLYTDLTSFVVSLTNHYTWFRGNKTSSFLKGKEVEDYVMEAIAIYLENQKKFDCTKSTLIQYLKYNIARSLISNDVNSSENKTSTAIVFPDENEEGIIETIVEKLADIIQLDIDSKIDYDTIFKEVEKELEEDEHATHIFIGLFFLNMKRREICKDCDMTNEDYDNGKRRMETVIKGVSNRLKQEKYG